MAKKVTGSKAAEATLRRALGQNPEMLLVLEMAKRAREIESVQPPREISVSTDVIATPTNSQCPV